MTAQDLLCRTGFGSLRVDYGMCFPCLGIGRVLFPFKADRTTVYQLARISENCFFGVAESSLGRKLLIALSLLDANSFKSISAAVTHLWPWVGVKENIHHLCVPIDLVRSGPAEGTCQVPSRSAQCCFMLHILILKVIIQVIKDLHPLLVDFTLQTLFLKVFHMSESCIRSQ